MLRLKRNFHFKKIDSTSAYLLRRRFVLRNFTFVCADYQSNGRGRQDRVWNSKNRENLLFSILIKDKALVNKYSSLSVCTAVCVIKLLIALGVKNVSYKWPNDVYVNDKKICGVLLNSVSDNDELSSLVIGVGLNVNQTDFDFDALTKPTSIKLELSKRINVNKLKKSLYKLIKKEFENVKKNTSDYLCVAKRLNYLKNKRVNAQINNKLCCVEVLDVNDDNSLKINLDGEILSINSGEITFHV